MGQFFLDSMGVFGKLANLVGCAPSPAQNFGCTNILGESKNEDSVFVTFPQQQI